MPILNPIPILEVHQLHVHFIILHGEESLQIEYIFIYVYFNAWILWLDILDEDKWQCLIHYSIVWIPIVYKQFSSLLLLLSLIGIIFVIAFVRWLIFLLNHHFLPLFPILLLLLFFNFQLIMKLLLIIEFFFLLYWLVNHKINNLFIHL